MKKAICILVTVIAAIFLVWFSAPIAYGVLNHGNILGIFICAALIFRFGFCKTWRRLKEWLKQRPFRRFILYAVRVIAAVFCIYAVTVSAFMVAAMLRTPPEGATAVILGTEVKPWGPGAHLRGRITAGEAYLNDHPETCAVGTGGKGDNEILSEGDCIKSVMVSEGIDESRIFVENRAANTYENIVFTHQFIEDNGLDPDMAIVSDSFHQLRAAIIVRRLYPNAKAGAVNSCQSPITLLTYPTFFVREWLAIPVEFMK